MKKGFTLIELTIVLGISIFVASALVASYISITKILSSEFDTSSIHLEGIRAMNTMTKEIRNCLRVDTATATSFSFWYQDTNLNNTSEASEMISYNWNGIEGASLTKTTAGATKDLAKHVKNLIFTYDSDTLSSIRNVTISLTLLKGSEISTFESQVRFRNL